MDAHVEPRRDDAEIVRKHGAAAHGQLPGYSQGQLDRAGDLRCIRIRIAARENVSDMKHPTQVPRHSMVRRTWSRRAARSRQTPRGAADTQASRHAGDPSPKHATGFNAALRYIAEAFHPSGH
ncbi:hypothetical protein [Burkholderia ambifaria]|uniref:hypothetical protein n=1 Tax=Burkholderia ambifaria TaxID=152480 RepID=UPI00158B84D9|nr:hypothetical protein [Burkholderia ambifaria]